MSFVPILRRPPPPFRRGEERVPFYSSKVPILRRPPPLFRPNKSVGSSLPAPTGQDRHSDQNSRSTQRCLTVADPGLDSGRATQSDCGTVMADATRSQWRKNTQRRNDPHRDDAGWEEVLSVWSRRSCGPDGSKGAAHARLKQNGF